MPTRYIQPDNLFPSQRHGFSHVAISSGAKVISIAGQVALDKDGNLVGRDDLGLQMAQALNNIDAALHSAGAGIGDIASMRIYIVGYQPEHGRIIAKTLKSHFSADSLPVSTWLGVSALAREDLLVEIEATAVV